MKRKFLLLTALCLVAILAFCLVACNDEGSENNPNGNNGAITYTGGGTLQGKLVISSENLEDLLEMDIGIFEGADTAELAEYITGGSVETYTGVSAADARAHAKKFADNGYTVIMASNGMYAFRKGNQIAYVVAAGTMMYNLTLDCTDAFINEEFSNLTVSAGFYWPDAATFAIVGINSVPTQPTGATVDTYMAESDEKMLAIYLTGANAGSLTSAVQNLQTASGETWYDNEDGTITMTEQGIAANTYTYEGIKGFSATYVKGETEYEVDIVLTETATENSAAGSLVISISAYDEGGDNPGGGDEPGGGDDPQPTYTRVESLSARWTGTFYGATQTLVLNSDGSATLGTQSVAVYQDETLSYCLKVGNNYFDLMSYGDLEMRVDETSYFKELDGNRKCFDSATIAGTYERNNETDIVINANGGMKIGYTTYGLWRNATTGAWYVYYSFDSTFEALSFEGNTLTYDGLAYTKMAPWVNVTSGLGSKAGYFENSGGVPLEISASGEVSLAGYGIGQLATRTNTYAIGLLGTYTEISFPTEDTVYYDDETYTRAARWQTVSSLDDDKAGFYEDGMYWYQINADGTATGYTGIVYSVCKRGDDYALFYTVYKTIVFEQNSITYDSNTYTEADPWEKVTAAGDKAGTYVTDGDYTITIAADGSVNYMGVTTMHLYKRGDSYAFESGTFAPVTFSGNVLTYSSTDFTKQA